MKSDLSFDKWAFHIVHRLNEKICKQWFGHKSLSFA